MIIGKKIYCNISLGIYLLACYYVVLFFVWGVLFVLFGRTEIVWETLRKHHSVTQTIHPTSHYVAQASLGLTAAPISALQVVGVQRRATTFNSSFCFRLHFLHYKRGGNACALFSTAFVLYIQVKYILTLIYVKRFSFPPFYILRDIP